MTIKYVEFAFSLYILWWFQVVCGHDEFTFPLKFFLRKDTAHGTQATTNAWASHYMKLFTISENTSSTSCPCIHGGSISLCVLASSFETLSLEYIYICSKSVSKLLSLYTGQRSASLCPARSDHGRIGSTLVYVYKYL